MKHHTNRDVDAARRTYSLAEEIANSITHGIGAVLSVAALVMLSVLAVHSGDIWRIVSFAIYGSSLIMLYLASTLYHSFQKPHIKQIFKLLDHCSIYLLIAGTYTPFLLISLKGAWGWALMSVIWGLALSGIVFKIFFISRFRKLSTAIYLLMGWLVVVAMKQLVASLPSGALLWLVVGGLSYTVGVIFYAWHKLPFNHAIWHLFVLFGSISHFLAIFLYLLPSQ